MQVRRHIERLVGFITDPELTRTATVNTRNATSIKIILNRRTQGSLDAFRSRVLKEFGKPNGTMHLGMQRIPSGFGAVRVRASTHSGYTTADLIADLKPEHGRLFREIYNDKQNRTTRAELQSTAADLGEIVYTPTYRIVGKSTFSPIGQGKAKARRA